MEDKKVKPEWRLIIDTLETIDVSLLKRIVRRMIHYLFSSDIPEIAKLMKGMDTEASDDGKLNSLYANMPHPKKDLASLKAFSDKVFEIAGNNIKDKEIADQINFLLGRERSRFLTIASENPNISLAEISGVLSRFMKIPRAEMHLSDDEFINIRVFLIRRFFSDNLQYINIAKHFLHVSEFNNLLGNVIGAARGAGKLGGKSSGLILAYKIIADEKINNPLLENIKIPNSWYLTSDTIMNFIHYNALEEMLTLKYLSTDEVRREYPYLQQIFKNSYFPPEIEKKLEELLRKIGHKPIIVRSSSLLEDSFGAAFSGKYKSLFLSNTGDIKDRLSALLDAIAEVYASTFGPDPIEYRKERGLIDFQEQMGILIQEVVGNQVGDYFFPTFAGVAFSNNEFRWSSRIKREDGVVRVVAGLGTRAVDRVSDDYSMLASPGQPGIRVNIRSEDIIKYAQNKIDVINLQTNLFETKNVNDILKEFADKIPGIDQIISINKYGDIVPPVGILWDPEESDMLITFQNLLDNSKFLNEMDIILKALRKAFNSPVDVEFACDGKNIYILQCRPQSQSKLGVTKDLPKNIKENETVFIASKYITSGFVPDIEYIVYVDGDNYGDLPELSDMKEVAKIVSTLNKKLPSKKFILIGPGRWGSRGDIKLGVPVTYSGINNTAMLIELAYNKDGYVPELSFGTHFFQDLVEADIKYLPVYPDGEESFFNLNLMMNSKNSLADYVSVDQKMSDVVRLISVKDLFDDKKMSVIMNGDENKAIGFIESKMSD